MSDLYIVGGAGYIGSHLQPLLAREGYVAKIIDVGIHGNVEAPENVFRVSIPYDTAPVVWLASLHKEPQGLQPAELEQWRQVAYSLMVSHPCRWAKTHPIIYVSSMQTQTDPECVYSQKKKDGELALLETAEAVQILRFGTVWGSLASEPPQVCRPQTAINRALLGDLPDENYVAYTTHLSRALDAILVALHRPYLGSIDNVLDDDLPMTTARLAAAIGQPVERCAPLDLQLRAEARRVTPAVRERLAGLTHPTELLAEYYGLPMPKKED